MSSMISAAPMSPPAGRGRHSCRCSTLRWRPRCRDRSRFSTSAALPMSPGSERRGSGGAPIASVPGPARPRPTPRTRAPPGGPPPPARGVAGSGTVNDKALTALLDNAYFERPAPKSLDRDAFDPAPLEGLSAADGAATLVAFTAAAVERAQALFPRPVNRWLVAGGGRHNPTIMAALAQRLGGSVAPVEAVGWDGDALEAQAFGYLAVRALRGLPLSLPTTTGVAHPLPGGRLHRATDRLPAR